MMRGGLNHRTSGVREEGFVCRVKRVSRRSLAASAETKGGWLLTADVRAIIAIYVLMRRCSPCWQQQESLSHIPIPTGRRAFIGRKSAPVAASGGKHEIIPGETARVKTRVFDSSMDPGPI